jgi:hypothetical protein
MVFFLFAAVRFGLSPLNRKSPRSEATSGSSLQMAPASCPLRSRAGEGESA